VAEYLSSRPAEPGCQELLSMGEEYLERACCARAAHAFEEALEAGCPPRAAAGLSLSLWCKGEREEALRLLRENAVSGAGLDGLADALALLDLRRSPERRLLDPEQKIRLGAVLFGAVASKSEPAGKYEAVLAHLAAAALSGAGLEVTGGPGIALRASGYGDGGIDADDVRRRAAAQGAEFAAILGIETARVDGSAAQELEALSGLELRLVLRPALSTLDRRARLEERVQQSSLELSEAAAGLREAEHRIAVCRLGLEYFERREEMERLVAEREALQHRARRLMNNGRISESEKVLRQVEDLEQRISALFAKTRTFLKHRLELELGVFDADPQYLRGELDRQQQAREEAIAEITRLEREVSALRRRLSRGPNGLVELRLPGLCSPVGNWLDHASLAIGKVLAETGVQAEQAGAPLPCYPRLLAGDLLTLERMRLGFAALDAADFEEAARLFRLAGSLAPEIAPPPEPLGLREVLDLPRPDAAWTLYGRFLEGLHSREASN
jgi:hypothetical protein